MTSLLPSIPQAPAPWNLTGDGYILVFKFSRSFVQAQGCLPSLLAPYFLGGIGGVKLVHYHSSNVGPYDELLFVPGRFGVGGHRFYRSITKIYVSTEASVVNGRANWGIPKELADFDMTPQESGERVQIRVNGELAADLSLQPLPVGLPVSANLVPPAWRTFVQPLDGSLFYTAPSGRGLLRPAKVVSAQVNSRLFPDFTQGRLLAAFRVESFELCFPLARQEALP